MDAGSWKFEGNGWTVWVRCDQGARRRIEDAWVAQLDVPFGAGRAAVFAVFDGLGGEPKGDVAAEAAAKELLRVVAASNSIHEVLPRLNDAVLTSGGFTTAVVAVASATGEVEIAHVGDSGAFALVNGTARLLTERDTALNGSITDFLGNERLRDHVSTTRVPSGASLLLCTDGVDGVVGTGSLAQVLASSEADVKGAIDRLYTEIHALGAPDNATLVWIRRNP